MISTVNIEKYFQKNINNLNLENNTLVAWKSGSLIDCQGKEQHFEKDKDSIQRKGEYDYTVYNKKPLKKRSFKKIVFEKVINR